jgi:hypothetical protein
MGEEQHSQAAAAPEQPAAYSAETWPASGDDGSSAGA